MSENLIALIVILVFLAVIFALWRGGKLSVKYKDIGVDAEGKQSAPTDQPSKSEEISGPTMSMNASGKGSAITGGKQSVHGASSTSPKLDMTASDGGKIKDAEQSVSNQDQEP